MKLLMNVRSNLSMEYPHACRCVVETLECVCKRLSVAGMFSFCPAVSHFLSELDIVLLKEFLHFLFYSDTEIGVFQLGGSDISIRLH